MLFQLYCVRFEIHRAGMTVSLTSIGCRSLHCLCPESRRPLPGVVLGMWTAGSNGSHLQLVAG